MRKPRSFGFWLNSIFLHMHLHSAISALALLTAYIGNDLSSTFCSHGSVGKVNMAFLFLQPSSATGWITFIGPASAEVPCGESFLADLFVALCILLLCPIAPGAFRSESLLASSTSFAALPEAGAFLDRGSLDHAYACRTCATRCCIRTANLLSSRGTCIFRNARL